MDIFSNGMCRSAFILGLYQIEPLRGADNYLSWRVQISDILRDAGLWGYVDGSKPCPRSVFDNCSAEMDRKALTLIRLRISSQVMKYVLSETTAKGVYDALAKVFKVQGAMARVTARRNFFRYQIDDSCCMVQELQRLQSLHEELGVVDSRPTDHDYALTILTSLPDSWDPFIFHVDKTSSSSHIILRILQAATHRSTQFTEPYTSETLAIVTARRNFFGYQINESDDLEEELRNLQARQERLAYLNSRPTDEEYALTILTALPASWDPFIASVGTTPSSSGIILRILQEAIRRKEH